MPFILVLLITISSAPAYSKIFDARPAVVKQLLRYNPTLNGEAKAAVRARDLFLLLKQEESRRELSPSLREHLVATFSHRHVFPDDEKVRQFYSNAVFALYRQLFRLVLLELYEKWSGNRVQESLQEFAASLTAQFLRPRDLSDRFLNLKSIEEIFSEVAPTFDWVLAEQIAMKWQSRANQSTANQSEVFVWFGQQSEAQRMPFWQQEKLVRALMGQGLQPQRRCCISKPGCFDCPNNRATLCDKFLTLPTS